MKILSISSITRILSSLSPVTSYAVSSKISNEDINKSKEEDNNRSMQIITFDLDGGDAKESTASHSIGTSLYESEIQALGSIGYPVKKSVKWELYKNGTLKISESGDTKLDSSKEWRRYNTSIKSVYTDESVISTDMSSWFYGCTKLQSIHFTIPNSITMMTRIFDGCSSLSSLPGNFIIPNSVTYMYRTFNECNSLTRLPEKFIIPEKIKNDIFFTSDTLPMVLSENNPMVSTYNWNSDSRYLAQIINLDSKGETIKNSKVLHEIGTTLDDLGVPIKDGCEFLGWFNSDN